MMERNFLFKAKIAGEVKELAFSAPVKDGFVITNKYCPAKLLTGGLPFATAINGESIEEFVSDCQAQVDVFSSIPDSSTKVGMHLEGLRSVVWAHINRCGRLIFGDLLIYMDCFSYLLGADGVRDEEVRSTYPRVLRSIVDECASYVKNTQDLSVFKGSQMDLLLYSLLVEFRDVKIETGYKIKGRF